MPLNLDRTRENPRPLAWSVTNIYMIANGRKFNATSKLQKAWLTNTTLEESYE